MICQFINIYRVYYLRHCSSIEANVERWQSRRYIQYRQINSVHVYIHSKRRFHTVWIGLNTFAREESRPPAPCFFLLFLDVQTKMGTNDSISRMQIVYKSGKSLRSPMASYFKAFCGIPHQVNFIHVNFKKDSWPSPRISWHPEEFSKRSLAVTASLYSCLRRPVLGAAGDKVLKAQAPVSLWKAAEDLLFDAVLRAGERCLLDRPYWVQRWLGKKATIVLQQPESNSTLLPNTLICPFRLNNCAFLCAMSKEPHVHGPEFGAQIWIQYIYIYILYIYIYIYFVVKTTKTVDLCTSPILSTLQGHVSLSNVCGSSWHRSEAPIKPFLFTSSVSKALSALHVSPYHLAGAQALSHSQ